MTMKMKTTTAALAALAFAFVGCEDKKTAVPHDHDGDGKPDHGPGAHGTPVPHDHDGDGKPDHGPGEHGDHDHAKKVAGPNGGKIMSAPSFKNELFVTDDRRVRITFLDEHNKPVAVGTQEVGIVGGDRSNPTTLTFTKAEDGMSLISSGTLPEGNNIPVIITVKTQPDAKPARASLSLNLADCPTCDYKEYACTCDHGGGHDHDHDHDHDHGEDHDHDHDGDHDHDH